LRPPADVFVFLFDVRNHRQQASSGIRVARALTHPCAKIAVCLWSVVPSEFVDVRTTVLESSEASALREIARVGRRPVVDVSWEPYQHESGGIRAVLSAGVRLGRVDSPTGSC
jgi:hypothetical protein